MSDEVEFNKDVAHIWLRREKTNDWVHFVVGDEGGEFARVGTLASIYPYIADLVERGTIRDTPLPVVKEETIHLYDGMEQDQWEDNGGAIDAYDQNEPDNDYGAINPETGNSHIVVELGQVGETNKSRPKT